MQATIALGYQQQLRLLWRSRSTIVPGRSTGRLPPARPRALLHAHDGPDDPHPQQHGRWTKLPTWVGPPQSTRSQPSRLSSDPSQGNPTSEAHPLGAPLTLPPAHTPRPLQALTCWPPHLLPTPTGPDLGLLHLATGPCYLPLRYPTMSAPPCPLPTQSQQLMENPGSSPRSRGMHGFC